MDNIVRLLGTLVRCDQESERCCAVYVDRETLIEMVMMAKRDMIAARARIAELEDWKRRARQRLKQARARCRCVPGPQCEWCRDTEIMIDEVKP